MAPFGGLPTCWDMQNCNHTDGELPHTRYMHTYFASEAMYESIFCKRYRYMLNKHLTPFRYQAIDINAEN